MAATMTKKMQKALQIELNKANSQCKSANKRLAKLKEDHAEGIQMATRTLSTMGGALGMAYLQGRFPERLKFFGQDPSLVSLFVGAGLSAAAALGSSDNEAANERRLYLESLGNGALAAFSATQGLQFGQEAKDAA